MRAGSGSCKNQGIFIPGIDEQPIRSDVAFTEALKVAMKRVVIIFVIKLCTGKKYVNDIHQRLYVLPLTDYAFYIFSEFCGFFECIHGSDLRTDY